MPIAESVGKPEKGTIDGKVKFLFVEGISILELTKVNGMQLQYTVRRKIHWKDVRCCRLVDSSLTSVFSHAHSMGTFDSLWKSK
jgi:hypothetical protein